MIFNDTSLPTYTSFLRTCSYHQNLGYIKEECYKIHELIEKLIRLEALMCFVQNDQV